MPDEGPVLRRPLSAAAGMALDAAVGERFLEPHPVALFGSLLEKLEERLWSDSKKSGVIYTAVALASAASVPTMAPSGWTSEIAACYVACAPKGLWDRALGVKESLERREIDVARRQLSELVGRETERLQVSQVTAAVIEAVAEGTVDAIVGPLFWGSVLGSHGSTAFRALNTLDSMVGYRSERYANFGWASARADDFACYVPARLSLVSLMIAMPLRSGAILSSVREYASSHESPNAGLLEAAFAGALEVSLGGAATYPGRENGRNKAPGSSVVERPVIGSGPVPTIHDIGRAVSASKSVSWVSSALLVTLGRLLQKGRAPARGRLTARRRMPGRV